MKMRNHKQNAEHPYLQKAAECVIKRMKTPEKLLSFLTDAISWVHDYGMHKRLERNDDHHFNFITMINDIVIPWQKENKNAKEVLTTGMYNLYDCFSYEGMVGASIELENALNHNFDEGGFPDPGTYREYMNGLKCIEEIVRCFEEHKANNNKIKIAA